MHWPDDLTRVFEEDFMFGEQSDVDLNVTHGIEINRTRYFFSTPFDIRNLEEELLSANPFPTLNERCSTHYLGVLRGSGMYEDPLQDPVRFYIPEHNMDVETVYGQGTVEPCELYPGYWVTSEYPNDIFVGVEAWIVCRSYVFNRRIVFFKLSADERESLKRRSDYNIWDYRLSIFRGLMLHVKW